ncbi:7-carboxy-7-deazaguanine synthase [Paramagnetospirillum magneticum]|uniref:7-carboxy-7-deazaguanine synthase n=1 Tax=Paramagnetospirillum magneticum (strain ATCC 700264 / AMB-1) TaxID=342108 RepID=Q2WAS4_PARM1|nr:7-carboxy-7-deazaguanine synthase [Paramagnetospirillum magneticum]BAE49051.1 Organic radical activating enzyme [Paramagnetospirillum magneticum AMB-1]
MSYTVREIFHSLQGEGVQAGRPAVFLRFAGCNLWSGREADRETATCRFCDTDFVGGEKYPDAQGLAEAVKAVGGATRYVVVTGGEPGLQLDGALVEALHGLGFEVAIETNGTVELPSGLDWVCVSPKAGTTLKVTRGDELKLVFPQAGAMPGDFEHLDFAYFLLQPMDGPERDAHTRAAIGHCLTHPRWRLSLQTHKIVGIP